MSSRGTPTTIDRSAVKVEFRAVPAEVWTRTRRLHEAMVRELLIIGLDSTEQDSAAQPVGELSRTVRAAVDTLRVGFKPFAVTVRADQPPISEGVTLSYVLPAEAIDVISSLEAVFAELDELARQGELLTPPSPDDVVQVRRWFFGECRRQFAGEPPEPYRPEASA